MTAPGAAASSAPPSLAAGRLGVRARRPPHPPSPSGGRSGLLLALTFLGPALLFLGAFVVWPALATAVRSLSDADGSRFVGLDNYQTMFELRRMRRAIANSFVWVAAFPVLVVGVGLILAVLSDRVSWKTAFKTVVFLPMAISLLASGVIWRIVYEADPDRGVINAVLNVPRALTAPTGELSGAVPSVDAVEVLGDRSLSAPVAVAGEGGVVRIGLLRLAVEQMPDGARAASDPRPTAGAVTGVVWRDIKPGQDTKGVVEEGEDGLPGVEVRLVDAGGDVVGSATTGDDGSFRIGGVEPGDYQLRVPGGQFRPPWEGVSWLGPSLVTPAAIIAAVWVWAGFSMVTIGAGLAAIDRQLLEAARVDGASEWQVFRRVTVPLLGPVLGVVFITMTINALKMFDLVFAVAPGSVQDDANVIALEMWRTAFTGAGNRGLGAAIAVFLFVLVLPILAFNIRRFRIEEGRR
ncbi:MAG TPA: ABC transporter permease subunit [Acidimicrobiales bacterium]|nr:ABC transporter permease subunit [Acidimicrobiales bacterium]